MGGNHLETAIQELRKDNLMHRFLSSGWGFLLYATVLSFMISISMNAFMVQTSDLVPTGGTGRRPSHSPIVSTSATQVLIVSGSCLGKIEGLCHQHSPV